MNGNKCFQKALALLLSLIFVISAVSLDAVQTVFSEAGAVIINEICSSNGGTDGKVNLLDLLRLRKIMGRAYIKLIIKPFRTDRNSRSCGLLFLSNS